MWKIFVKLRQNESLEVNKNSYIIVCENLNIHAGLKTWKLSKFIKRT